VPNTNPGRRRSKVAQQTVPKVPRTPSARHRAEIYGSLLQLPNVRGCFIGHRRKDGRLTRELTVVCGVDEKVPRRSLRAAQRVPTSVQWPQTSRRVGSLPTDVQPMGESIRHGAVLGAGDQAVSLTAANGVTIPTQITVGAAMRHPVHGDVVTTAAHGVGAAGYGVVSFPPGMEPRIGLRNGGQGQPRDGIVHRVCVMPDADYAIIGAPPGVDVANLYQDTQPLGQLYTPQPSDLTKVAFVLAVRGIVATRIRGIHGAFPVGHLGFEDLILTDVCTLGGDSGGCLVDGVSNLMGFVEGQTTFEGKLYSVFTSAGWPFVHESAFLL
jgi:hypothetical protein